MRSIVQCFGAAFCILASAAGPAWAFNPALPYGINAHLPSSAMLDRVAAAGIAWILVDFNWVTMEPARGVYDWTITDTVVSDAGGISTAATVRSVKPRAPGQTRRPGPAPQKRFERFP